MFLILVFTNLLRAQFYVSTSEHEFLQLTHDTC